MYEPEDFQVLIPNAESKTDTCSVDKLSKKELQQEVCHLIELIEEIDNKQSETYQLIKNWRKGKK